jgi:site-specific recombinase XerD
VTVGTSETVLPEALSALGYHKRTINTLVYAWRQFGKTVARAAGDGPWYEAPVPATPEAITGVLTAMAAQRRADGAPRYSARTVREAVAAVRVCYRALADSGLLKSNPARDVRPPAVATRRPRLSDVEVAELQRWLRRR